ncbi:MAG: ABC transporter transmembrane domain-containing protein, partial [Gammaproteobacteria bacterium]|nr:ABC transporter transmembrane domain-containing protein [Gammaproteobacteria bacterium]
MTLEHKAEVGVVMRRLLRYVKPYSFVIVPAGVAITIYALLSGTVPFLVGDIFGELTDRVVDSATEGTSLIDALTLPLAIVIIFALRGTMDFLTIYGLSWVGRSAVRDLRTELFRQFLYLPEVFFDRNATGDLISKLTFNTEQVADAISNSIVIIVRDILLIIVMIGVMIYLDVQLTLILAVVGPVVALLLGAMSRAFRRYSTRIQNSMGDVTRAAGQALTGQRVVKSFSGQEYEAKRFDEINRRNFRLHLRLVAARAFGDVTTQFVVAVGIAVLVFFVVSGFLG